MDCDNLLNVTMLLDQEMSKTGSFQDFDIGVLQKKERGAHEAVVLRDSAVSYSTVRGADPGNTGPPENM